MPEVWCNECGSEFGPCQHDTTTDLEKRAEVNAKRERWHGADGHAYIGDPDRASVAYHDDENCLCGDPEAWY